MVGMLKTLAAYPSKIDDMTIQTKTAAVQPPELYLIVKIVACEHPLIKNTAKPSAPISEKKLCPNMKACFLFFQTPRQDQLLLINVQIFHSCRLQIIALSHFFQKYLVQQIYLGLNVQGSDQEMSQLLLLLCQPSKPISP